MATETRISSFPETQQDISRLKQTAIDAVVDLGNTAANHATTARNHLKALSGHVQEEGSEHLDQIKGRLTNLACVARDYASERPLACIGVALVVGYLIGRSRRRAPLPEQKD